MFVFSDTNWHARVLLTLESVNMDPLSTGTMFYPLGKIADGIQAGHVLPVHEGQASFWDQTAVLHSTPPLLKFTPEAAADQSQQFGWRFLVSFILELEPN